MKKVLTNVFAQFLGKVLTVFAAFFVVKIVSGFGREFYGEYVTAYEFLAFFGILADMGLFAIAVRDMSRTSDKGKVVGDSSYILGNILSIRLVFIVTATILAGILAQFVPNYSDMVKQGIWITGLSMALTIVAGTLSSVLQAKMKIQYFSGSLVFGKILLALMIFGISRNLEIFGEDPLNLFFLFLWAGVISNFIFCTLTAFFVQRIVKISLRFDPEYWKETLKTSLPYGAALILQTLYLRSDLILISIILGSSAIGTYGVAARVMESFLVLGVFFGQSMLPKLSAEESHNGKSSRSLYWGIETLTLFSLPILIGIFFFSKDIVLLLSSAEFVSTESFFGADKALLILVPTVIFAYFNQLFSFALVSKNKQHFLLIVNAAGLLCNVGLNLYFLPRYGIAAAAVSTVVCEILVFSLLVKNIWKYFEFCLDYIKVLIIVGLNIGIFLMIFLTNLRENLIVSLALSSLIYFGILVIFRKRLLR